MHARRARALLLALTATATATAHNIVRIRGELIADEKGLLVQTSWTDGEIASFRFERDEWAGPTVGNLDEVTAVGAALAQGLCLVPAPSPATAENDFPSSDAACIRSEFVELALIAEQRDADGHVEVERRWRLTHRIRLEDATQRGWLRFMADGALRTHPLSLVLADRHPPERGHAEFTMGRQAARLDYSGVTDDPPQWRVRLSGHMLCGVSRFSLYGCAQAEHRHRDRTE